MIPEDIKALLEEASEDDLSDLVLETAKTMAEELNREGVAAQVAFLRDAGVSWKYIREALSYLDEPIDFSQTAVGREDDGRGF